MYNNYRNDDIENHQEEIKKLLVDLICEGDIGNLFGDTGRRAGESVGRVLGTIVSGFG